MTNKMKTKKRKKDNKNMLPIIAGLVLVLAVGLFVGKNIVDSSKEKSNIESDKVVVDNNLQQDKQTEKNISSNVSDAEVENGKVKVQASKLSEQITLVDYDSNGTKMELMLVKTSDGVIRGALNTCQVCNGSPYAYFEQQGDMIVCQNCYNQFSLSDIGVQHGGCNPIPLDFKTKNDYIFIDTAFLDENSSRFVGWKQGV